MADTDKELKPCPFCGMPAHMGSYTGTKSTHYHVTCRNNGCTVHPETHAYRDKQALIEKWNRRADLAPAPLLAPDRVGIWACHTNSNGSVWVVPVEGAKPVQLRSDFDEGIERWYWLSEPDTQEQSNDRAT